MKTPQKERVKSIFSEISLWRILVTDPRYYSPVEIIFKCRGKLPKYRVFIFNEKERSKSLSFFIIQLQLLF